MSKSIEEIKPTYNPDILNCGSSIDPQLFIWKMATDTCTDLFRPVDDELAQISSQLDDLGNDLTVDQKLDRSRQKTHITMMRYVVKTTAISLGTVASLALPKIIDMMKKK